MKHLEKRITGDWIDIREAGGDHYSLQEFLSIKVPDINSQISALSASIDEGAPEYKRTLLHSVFLTLESAKFQSLSTDELEAHRPKLGGLLFTTLVQKLLCSGTIPVGRREKPEEIATEGIELNTIISELKERIDRQPELQKHPAVKNIYMQLNIYQKEKEKMQELSPKIKEDMESTFKQNFEEAFERIFESIRKNYSIIISEEAARKRAALEKDILKLLPIKNLVPLLTEQATEISRIRSTLAFAAEDKYKIRSILVNLYEGRERVLSMVEAENRAYLDLCSQAERANPKECAGNTAARFREELVRILERIKTQIEN